MILLIDNYDSFSYNLYQLIGTFNPDVQVVRNDQVSLADIVVLRPSHVVLSPGPGRPVNAGICEAVIAQFSGKIPILGVCLGHQAICEVYGGVIGYATTLMHGKASDLNLDRGSPLFSGLPSRIQAGRYHSLAVDPTTLPQVLQVTAWTDQGEVMAVQHRQYPVYGVQFHPESVLTPLGPQMLQNFLALRCP